MPPLNTFIALLAVAVSLLALPAAEGFLVPPTSSSISTSSLSAAKDGVKAGVPRPRRRRMQQQPRRRRLSPPFPNGLCGGSLVVLPPEQTYGYNEEDNAYITAASSGDATSILLPPRPISVWLPPSYEASGRKRHRVIYVHDGQNSINDTDSWTGSSWRMAGALTRLAERGALDTGYDDVDPLPILVLLPSADGDFVPGMRRRHLEYGEGIHGEHHADFIAEKLMPLVNDRFRTVTEPEGAMAIGTSMGGQASLHLLLRHPTMFGGAACLSPAFQPATIASVATSGDLLKTKRLYLDNGGDDDNANVRVPMFDLFDHITPKAQWNPGYFWLDTQLQPAIDAMRATLDFNKISYEYRKFPGGRHNEREWAKRIDLPLMHLLGNEKVNGRYGR